VSSRADSLAAVQARSYESASPTLRGSWPERQALDADGIAAFLSRHRYAVVATGRTDGRPHAAPVAFTVVGGTFWIATVEGLRARNLRATPWVSLVVMQGSRDAGEGTDTHVALTAEGPVVLHEGEAFAVAFEQVREPWLARHGRGPDWAVALAELRPQRVFSHDASR